MTYSTHEAEPLDLDALERDYTLMLSRLYPGWPPGSRMEQQVMRTVLALVAELRTTRDQVRLVETDCALWHDQALAALRERDHLAGVIARVPDATLCTCGEIVRIGVDP